MGPNSEPKPIASIACKTCAAVKVFWLLAAANSWALQKLEKKHALSLRSCQIGNEYGSGFGASSLGFFLNQFSVRLGNKIRRRFIQLLLRCF